MLTLAFDVLNGIPAIVLGIFVFVFVVVRIPTGKRHQDANPMINVPMIALARPSGRSPSRAWASS